MKSKTILGLVLTMSLICTSLPAYALNSNVTNPAPVQGIVNNKINFEEVSSKDAPKNLLEMINSNKESKGFLFTIDEATGYIYIAVMGGSRPTGGYSIKVTGIDDNEGKTNVFVNEITPEKDLYVTQVITYPYTIVKAKGITSDITVTNPKGVYFNNLAKDALKSNILDTRWKDLKGYTNVLEDKEWTIKFNKSISDVIITSDIVYILDSLGNKVGATLTLSDDKKVIKIKPTNKFEFAETYYLFISKEIFGKEKNKSIIEGYRMMFSTRNGITVE